jgi:hypothetical protein
VASFYPHIRTMIHPLPDYFRIKQVESFDELINTPFGNGINALCWPRALTGNFSEVVEKLGAGEGITSLEESDLEGLPLSAAGKQAIDRMLEDFRLLEAHGLSPILDCIHGYPRDEDTELVPTHVFSYHADSAPVEADTYLCTYHGASSEGLRNEDAQRRVDIPQTRAALLEMFGGSDNEAFEEFLKESCYDLHYASKANALPYSFGIGNLWRIAIQYPDCPVPPCIHRAPETLPGQTPRLLLIS